MLARHLIETTRTYRILQGKEGAQRANLLLEEILIRLSQLASDFPEIVDLEINPLILGAESAVAGRSMVCVKPAEVAAPQHLVISSYPSQYEMQTVTSGGMEVFLRPIKPEESIYPHFLDPPKTY